MRHIYDDFNFLEDLFFDNIYNCFCTEASLSLYDCPPPPFFWVDLNSVYRKWPHGTVLLQTVWEFIFFCLTSIGRLVWRHFFFSSYNKEEKRKCVLNESHGCFHFTLFSTRGLDIVIQQYSLPNGWRLFYHTERGGVPLAGGLGQYDDSLFWFCNCSTVSKALKYVMASESIQVNLIFKTDHGRLQGATVHKAGSKIPTWLNVSPVYKLW
jgi:hypothetical protein